MTLLADPGVAARRKRLGQFFTGEKLALLLAHLAGAASAQSIIDPMAGSGDMLIGTRLAGAATARLAAIELDPAAVELLRNRPALDGAGVVVGSAFDTSCYEELGWSWDLVITNPPYVRYQNSAKVELPGVSVPSAAEVRAGLRAVIEHNPTLSQRARMLFLESCSYSGLSDLAVPSWILAASLVGVGGCLALVLPDTWLSRSYAHPVIHILEQLFDLNAVVEDRDAAWFPGALVRTTLVVARRATGSTGSLGHRHISVPALAGSDSSLVGGVFVNSTTPERDFAKWIYASDLHQVSRRGMIQVRPSDGSDLSAHAVSSGRAATNQHKYGSAVPESLQSALGTPLACQSLADLHWRIGQGLRTGANDFFYLRSDGGGKLLSVLTGRRRLEIDSAFLLDAIRRQADLRTKPSVRSAAGIDGGWRLLVVDDYALAEDAEAAGADYKVVDGDLALLIAHASTAHHVGAEGPTIPELTAVAVNVRSANAATGRPERFWYQLPALARRHRPELFVARVNTLHPLFYINSEPAKVIDANFSALYREGWDGPSPTAMLAFLSSTWTSACLEASGTRLAGGALKVEAIHLRRLPVPAFSESTWLALDRQGRHLAEKGASDQIIDSIDETMAHVIAAPNAVSKLRELATGLLAKRVPT